jgi:hypothetical protein
MFSFFKTEDVEHPLLGKLKWSRGCWRGEVTLPGKQMCELVLGGTRKAPDARSLQHAVNVTSDLTYVEEHLKQALYEHYEPYAEAVREGHLEVQEGKFPEVSGPAEALKMAEPEAVAIIVLDGQLATEVCYRVPWDEEHTLGARFRGPQWVELCGSTLVP